MLPTLAGRIFDLVLTDVPYWKMDRAPRSRGAWKRVGETARPVRGSRLADFGAGGYADKAEWLASMGEIFARAAVAAEARRLPRLVHRGHVPRQRVPLPVGGAGRGAARVSPASSGRRTSSGTTCRRSLHLYGYQYAYIPSLIHQNILVFRREAEAPQLCDASVSMH